MSWATERSVLVVDDHPFSLRVMSLMLGRVGFSVLTAEDYESAINTFADSQGLALLVVDVRLKSGNGIELADRFVSGRPELKVLVTSGAPFVDLNFAIHQYAFLPKPFNAQQFAQAVQRVMSAPRWPQRAEARAAGATAE